MKVYAVMHHVYYEGGNLIAIYKKKKDAIKYCRNQEYFEKEYDEDIWEGSDESYEIETIKIRE